MNTQTRNEALVEVIRQGLEVSGDCNAVLGNRSRYLGISELARHAECPRAALMGKLYPKDNSLNKLLTLQRGHWFEEGLSSCFIKLQLNFLSQLEISITHGNVPIKAHLDFTLVWDKPAIRIVEVKSMDKLPTEPYKAHVFQAQAQVNLLYHYWERPVFGLRDNTGRVLAQKLSFPQICKTLMGITLPSHPDEVSLESWLLCLSMKEAACFGPYVADDESLEQMLLLAERAWVQYTSLHHNPSLASELPNCTGFNPLCSYCEFNQDCPKFSDNILQPQWDLTIKEHEKLKAEKAALDERIRSIENSLKEAHKLSGLKGWIEAGDHRFRVVNAAGRTTLDRNSLQTELAEIFNARGITDLDVDALFARHERIGAASSRLNIMPIN